LGWQTAALAAEPGVVYDNVGLTQVVLIGPSDDILCIGWIWLEENKTFPGEPRLYVHRKCLTNWRERWGGGVSRRLVFTSALLGVCMLASPKREILAIQVYISLLVSESSALKLKRFFLRHLQHALDDFLPASCLRLACSLHPLPLRSGNSQVPDGVRPGPIKSDRT
jgi:hypothetical protein